MAQIPDFTETELWIVRSTLKERYGREVELELAEAELRLSPEAQTLTPCPTVFWSERGAHFVICKLGDNHFRPQFYYRGYQQFGTGRDRYDNLAECVTTVLQVQADHERERSEAEAGPAGVQPKASNH